MKKLIQKYKHAWVFVYALFYMPAFIYLEQTVTVESGFHIIHSSIDDVIPFMEIFIIPYLLWFAFIFVIGAYLFFTNVKDFYKFSIYLGIGMTIFIIISFAWPNGHNLRESIAFERDNIFMDLVKTLHKADTCTNIFPSVHVYNTIVAWVAVAHNKTLQKKKWIQVITLILAILIILSTMFLKQHSFPDVAGAILLAATFYFPIYRSKRFR